MIATFVLSGLALLAACASIFMAKRNEKRSKERNAALVRYAGDLDTYCRQYAKRKSEELASELRGEIDLLKGKVDSLASGIVPDYEQAKAAANAVNDFSKGISNILGFDPMEALKKQREQDEVGGVE